MFKRKLTFYYLSLVIAALVISGFIISKAAIHIYKNQAEEELRSHISLAAYFIKEINPDDLEQFAVSLSRNFNTHIEEGHDIRVTFISPSGEVLGDSEAVAEEMDNHGNRPEIIDASNMGIGVSTRKSDTTSLEYMYIASKLESGNYLRLSLPLSHIRQLTRSIYIYMVAGIAAALILSILLGYRLSRYFTVPVGLLSAHAAEISKGNYSHRIPHEPGDDELMSLMDTFNAMTVDLEKSFIRLSDRNNELNTLINAINDGIIAVDSNNKVLFANNRIKGMSGFVHVETGCDISMIKNSDVLKIIDSTMKTALPCEKEINRQGKSIRCSSSYFELHSGPCVVVTMQDITDIKKLENMKYDFVSNVTHELNTPLTSIQGFIETLKSGAIKDPETAEKFLNIIEIESERLSNLIGDILTLSSIENESRDREREFVGIHEAASEALQLLKGKIEDKGISVINDIDPLAGIEANYDRIKQLFINLLDNAVKYNTDSGEIRLYTVEKGEMLEIHVRDTGIGIDKKHSERLFERFYRVDRGRSRELGGTGLGLSIVKHIAMLYGGRVSVESEPGKGSDFCATFPKAG